MSMFIPATLAGGRYTVGNLIGHGGMAEVHVGTDTRLGRTVAIKIMRADLASDSIFISRFHREAHAVAQMNNANIVSIYDSGEESIRDDAGRNVSVPYLVMEYVQGRTLRDILKEHGALSVQDAQQVMLGVLSALEYSHRMGIIHRDIKPGNIMINEQGMVKVMDFGIARALDDSAATMTQAQGVVGTAQYLSPEQARGENVDMRSDLYSAGCVLYEMLTGRPPFTGDSAVAIAYQHVTEIATPPSAIVPGLPRMWDSICAKAMAKDRQNRYTTATEFRNDIVTMMRGGTPTAAQYNALQDLPETRVQQPVETAATAAMAPITGVDPSNPLEQFAEEVPVEQPQELSRSEQRKEAAKKKKRNRIIIASVVAALAVIAVGLGIWFASRGGIEPMATVPTISAAMSKDQACSKIEDAGFVCKTAEDNDSSEDQGTFTKQSPKGGEQAKKGSTVTVWFSSGPKRVAIPDLKGATQDEARKKLEDLGFKVNGTAKVENSGDVEKDMVTRTDPAATTEQIKGSTITIYISSGMTEVPGGLAGLTQDEALRRLHDAGLTPVVREESSDSVEKGKVTRVEPGEGTQVEQNAQVTLYVSTGVEQLNVPSVVGLTLGEARNALRGFNVQVAEGSSSDDNAEVTAQDPQGGQAAKGSTVTLTTQANNDTFGITGQSLDKAKKILDSKSVSYSIKGPNSGNATVSQVIKNSDGSYTIVTSN